MAINDGISYEIAGDDVVIRIAASASGPGRLRIKWEPDATRADVERASAEIAKVSKQIIDDYLIWRDISRLS